MSNIKTYAGLAVVAIVVTGAGIGMYQANRPPAPTAAPTAVLSPMTKAIGEVAAGQAILIDVRTPAEYAAGHARGAINLDSVEIQAGKLPELAKDARIYIYCRSGHRAGVVLPILKGAGFTNVTNLGALQSWLDAGGPKA